MKKNLLWSFVFAVLAVVFLFGDMSAQAAQGRRQKQKASGSSQVRSKQVQTQQQPRKMNGSVQVKNRKNIAAQGDDDDDAEVECPYGDCPDGSYCSEWTNGCCYKCKEYEPGDKPLPVRQAR